MGSPKLFDEHGVEEMMESARENAESRKRRQVRRKTRLHASYYRRVSHGYEEVKCAVLKEMNLKAREVLRLKASDTKLPELEKKKGHM